MKKYPNTYLDHNATTYLDEEVLKAMLPFLTERYANPSSIYRQSLDNRQIIDESKAQMKKMLNADDDTRIVFTGGGSEADNLAIKGYALANKKKGNHIITSAIEHHAVLHTCEYLEKQGFEVSYIPVNKEGVVDIEQLKQAIRAETILITIMYANNETGVIQPIRDIGRIALDRKIVFHTDAVQAVGRIDIDLQQINVDMLTVSAHKLYGPKGIGALYIKKAVRIDPLIHGGQQEYGLRAGTENVAGIVGFAKAMELSLSLRPQESKRLSEMRNRLQQQLLAMIPESQINGDLENRLPNTLNMIIKYIEGEGMLLLLDKEGINVSSGSACTSGSLEPSHVLLAMGIPHGDAHGSIRISLGRLNTEEDITKLIEVLPLVVEKLRSMSPLWEG